MFSVSQAARRLGVCAKTIRRWDTRGLIHCIRTPGNHRRITLTEVNRLLGVFQRELLVHPTKKQCAVYARVSGHRQKTDGDLDRQLTVLTIHCRRYFKTRPLIFTDIGSGLNMKRRGLKRLLALAQSGAIDTLLITHRNRLARQVGSRHSWNLSTNLWGQMIEGVRYRREALGHKQGGIWLVNPAWTSQTCHVCGERGVRVEDESSTTERKGGEYFHCSKCDEHFHADVNAARNIMYVQQPEPSAVSGRTT